MVYDVPADAVEFVRNDDVEVISVPRWYQHLLTLQCSRARAQVTARAKGTESRRSIARRLSRRSCTAPAKPSSGPIYPEVLGLRCDAVPSIQFDPAAAAALLDAAGYPLRQDVKQRAAPGTIPIHLSAAAELHGMGTHRSRNSAGSVQRRRRHAVQGRCRSKSSTHLVEHRAFRGRVHRHDQRADAVANVHVVAVSANASKVRINVFGYENAEAERLFEILLRSTNEAAIRSAIVEAAAGSSMRTRRRYSSPGIRGRERSIGASCSSTRRAIRC